MDKLNNNIIWHYTSYNVLEKIFFENKNGPQMRATHFKDFIDKNEITRVAGIVQGFLKNKNLSHFLRPMKLLEQLISSEKYLNGYYVLSFAFPKDSPYHWNMYADKDGSGGCAIGFNQNQLSKLFSHVLINKASGGMSTQGPMFRQPLPCIYENDEEKIKTIFNSIINIPNYLENDEISILVSSATVTKMISFLLMIKEERYREDAEMRLGFYYKTITKEDYQVIDGTHLNYCQESDKKYLYCSFNMKVLQNNACSEIMLAKDTNITRGLELIKEINKKYKLNIQASVGNFYAK